MAIKSSIKESQNIQTHSQFTSHAVTSYADESSPDKPFERSQMSLFIESQFKRAQANKEKREWLKIRVPIGHLKKGQMASQWNKEKIDQLKANQATIPKNKQEELERKAEDCNYCRTVNLREIKFPARKMEDLYYQEFIEAKNKQMLEDLDDKEQEKRVELLRKVVYEMEKKELINRKIFQLRLQTVYGRDPSEELDFNCHT